MHRYVVLAGCVSLVSGALGFAVAWAAPPSFEQAPSAVPTPTTGPVRWLHRDHGAPQPAAPIGDVELACAGGAQNPLELRLVPVRSIRSAQGEQIEVDLQVENRFDTRASVAYSVELIDDIGAPILPPVLAPVKQLDRLAGKAGERLLSPSGLPDGFYELRVRAVSKAEDTNESATETSLRFQIQGGALLLLEYEDWMRFSRASLSAPRVRP